MDQFDALEWLAYFGRAVVFAEWFNRHTNYSEPGPTAPPVSPLSTGAVGRMKVI